MGNSQTQTKTKTKKRRPRSDSESSDDSDSGSSSDESAVKQKQAPEAKAAPPPAPKILDRPTFTVDENKLDSGRYELWSVRLPASMSIQDLDGCEVYVPSSAAQIVPGGPALAEKDDSTSKPVSFPSKDGTKCSLRWGHSVENDAFRVLLPQEQERKASDDDSSSDDDDEATKKAASNQLKFLSPSSAPFKRHLNVVSYVEEVSETKLAPGITNAPKPSLAEGTKMRIAYDSVPQRPNLKRRWMPLGSKGAARVAQTTLDEASDKPNRKRSSSQMSNEQKKDTSKRKRKGSTSSKVKTESLDEAAIAGSKMNKRKRADSSSRHTKNGAHPAVLKKEDDSTDIQSPFEKKARKPKVEDEIAGKEMSSTEDASPVKKEESTKESKAERKARKAEKKARKAEKKAKKEKKQKKKVKEEG